MKQSNLLIESATPRGMTRLGKIFVILLLVAFNAPAAEILKAGGLAPVVIVHDQANKPWNLEDTLSRPTVKAVLMYFYPKDNTPGCTKQACGFRDRISTFIQKGVEVVGISCDSVASHQRFAKKFNLTFTLLADVKCKAADAYGVRVPKRNLTRRVSFLIGKEGKILRVFDHRDPLRHIAEMQMAIEKHLQ